MDWGAHLHDPIHLGQGTSCYQFAELRFAFSRRALCHEPVSPRDPTTTPPCEAEALVGGPGEQLPVSRASVGQRGKETLLYPLAPCHEAWSQPGWGQHHLQGKPWIRCCLLLGTPLPRKEPSQVERGTLISCQPQCSGNPTHRLRDTGSSFLTCSLEQGGDGRSLGGQPVTLCSTPCS